MIKLKLQQYIEIVLFSEKLSIFGEAFVSVINDIFQNSSESLWWRHLRSL